MVIAFAAEMGIEQLADEGARHDHALVDVKGQAAQVDFVDEVSCRFSRSDAARNHVEYSFGLARRDPRGREGLELVGMKMQGFADQECGLGHGIGGAVREQQFGLDKAAYRIADEVEQRQQLAGCEFRKFRYSAAALCDRPGALRHQDLVQRSAAASSWVRDSTQLVPAALSSRFQNGPLAFR